MRAAPGEVSVQSDCREQGGGVASSRVFQQQLAVRAGVLALLAWKHLTCVMAASVEVQALLLDADGGKTCQVTMVTGRYTIQMEELKHRGV